MIQRPPRPTPRPLTGVETCGEGPRRKHRTPCTAREPLSLMSLSGSCSGSRAPPPTMAHPSSTGRFGCSSRSPARGCRSSGAWRAVPLRSWHASPPLCPMPPRRAEGCSWALDVTLEPRPASVRWRSAQPPPRAGAAASGNYHSIWNLFGDVLAHGRTSGCHARASQPPVPPGAAHARRSLGTFGNAAQQHTHLFRPSGAHHRQLGCRHRGHLQGTWRHGAVGAAAVRLHTDVQRLVRPRPGRYQRAVPPHPFRRNLAKRGVLPDRRAARGRPRACLPARRLGRERLAGAHLPRGPRLRRRVDLLGASAQAQGQRLDRHLRARLVVHCAAVVVRLASGWGRAEVGPGVAQWARRCCVYVTPWWHRLAMCRCSVTYKPTPGSTPQP
eukprot:scaffold47086_cov60-Phaeocystis_antarctica.AAC.5